LSTISSTVEWIKPQGGRVNSLKKVVGASGFEPPTSWSRTRRASQAALRPEPCESLQSSLLGNATNGNTLHPDQTSPLGPTTSYRDMIFTRNSVCRADMAGAK